MIHDEKKIELVSSPQDGESHGQAPGPQIERRRMPRLNLTTEQFRLKSNGRIFSVVDLSSDGMALRVVDRNDLYLFPIGAHIEGTLNLKREKFPVKAKVCHIGRDLVGCQFGEIDDVVLKAIQSFLDPVILGRELRPIPSAEDGMLWYRGPTGTDLLLWREPDGRFRRIVLLVLGTFAQWSEEAGISTGRVSSSFEESEVRGVFRFETMLLEADSAPNPNNLSIAKTVIMSSNLPLDLRKWCVRQLALPS